MLTDKDINKLRTIFVTKQELQQLRVDMNYHMEKQTTYIIDTLTKTMMEIISPIVELNAKHDQEISHIKTHLRSI